MSFELPHCPDRDIVLARWKGAVRTFQNDVIVVAPLKSNPILQGKSHHPGVDFVKPVLPLPKNAEPKVSFCRSENFVGITNVGKHITHESVLLSSLFSQPIAAR